MTEIAVVLLVAFFQAAPLPIGHLRSQAEGIVHWTTAITERLQGAAGLVRDKPLPDMDVNPITITVTQGSTAVLPCSVDPIYTEQQRDQYKIVWVNPSQTVISMEDRRMINDMRISVERPFLWDWNLHIRNVSITDAGEYLCQLNTVPVQSKKINLLVNVPPSLADWTEPTEMTRMEGQLVELFCNATGVPEPKVTWHRMNKWQPGTSERVGSNGEHLVIHNVTRMCADTYYCVADNGVPPATKMEFHVNVNYPPEIDLHNGRIGQEVGKETILECVISASPLHVSRWRRGQEIYSNEGDRHEVNVYDQNKEPNSIVLSLRILRVEQQDYGTYTCEASNNFGTVVRDMELYEVRPRPPPTTPTTTTTTTSPDNVWRQQGGNSENIHRHGSGSRSKKPGQVGNYHGDRHSPDVIRNSQDSGSRNSGYAGNGAFGSTPRPSGQLGSGGMYDPNAREVYDQNGSRSISAYSHCILVMLCLTSSFLWMTLRDV